MALAPLYSLALCPAQAEVVGDALRLAAAVLGQRLTPIGAVYARWVPKGRSKAAVRRRAEALPRLLALDAALREAEGMLEGLPTSTPLRLSAPEGPSPRLLCLSAEEAGDLEDALELYERVLMGQMDEAATIMQERCWGHPSEVHFELNDVKSRLRSASPLATGIDFPGQYHGIHSPEIPDAARVAYDLQKVIRHRLAHDRLRPGERPGWGLQYDEPRVSSKSGVALAAFEPSA